MLPDQGEVQCHFQAKLYEEANAGKHWNHEVSEASLAGGTESHTIRFGNYL